MIFKSLVFRFVILCIFIGASNLQTFFILGIGRTPPTLLLAPRNEYSFSEPGGKSDTDVKSLNGSLLNYITINDLVNAKSIALKIIQKIKGNKIDESILSESYYLIGIYYFEEQDYFESTRYLALCIAIKEKNNEIDNRYFKALYNLSVTSFALGDLNKFEKNASKSLEIGKKIFGDSNPDLAFSYFSLLTAYIELNEYEKALINSNDAINIIKQNPGKVSPLIQAGIYVNIGVCYTRLRQFLEGKNLLR